MRAWEDVYPEYIEALREGGIKRFAISVLKGAAQMVWEFCLRLFYNLNELWVKRRGCEGMEIIIKGEAKEIAALLLEIEGRRNKEADVDKIAQTISKTLSSTRYMNSLL